MSSDLSLEIGKGLPFGLRLRVCSSGIARDDVLDIQSPDWFARRDIRILPGVWYLRD